MGIEYTERQMKFEGTRNKAERLCREYVSGEKVTLQFLEISG